MAHFEKDIGLLNFPRKLSESQVRHIRSKELKQKEYAEMYGLHQTTVSKIQLGLRYGWVKQTKGE